MRSYTLMMSLLALLLAAGCLQDLLHEGDGLVSITATVDASSTSSTGPSTPTTSAGSGVQTVTGNEETTGPSATSPGDSSESSSGDAVNQPPTIELFAADDDYIDEAGPITLTLSANDDHAVVKVRLYLDGVKLADLTPAHFPYTYDVLSAKFNGDQRIFKVVVEDAEGLTAEKQADPVKVWLPASGAEKCIFTDPVDGDVLSIISALTYTPKGEILAVGTRGAPGALRLTAWLIDPKSCDTIPGWPKSLKNWSDDEGFTKLTSLGTAVAIDEDGNLIVAGNFIVDNKPQGYAALLNSSGAQLWEKPLQVGDEVSSVAAGTGLFSNRVFVGGAQRTSDNPVRTDGAVWVYHATDGDVFVGPPTTLRAPFTPEEFDDELNDFSEWVRAIVIQPGMDYAVAVGEREVRISPNEIYSRTFIVRVHPLGGIVGTPWTSPANASFVHDAMRSIAVCGDGLMAGGWTRDKPVDAEPVPMMFWIDAAGSGMMHRADPQMSSTETHGIACDREGKIVSAATRTSGATDAQVFAVLGPDDPRITYDSGVPGNDAAVAVACDARGFCGRGGYQTADAKPYAVVRIHHP